MPEELIFSIIFLVGILGGGINTIAGGGSLVCMPVLAFLGLPVNVANATNNVATTVQSLAACWGYTRRGFGNGRLMVLLAIPALVGAVGGAFLVVDLPEEAFAKIVAFLMIGALVVILRVKPDESPTRREQGRKLSSLRVACVGIPVFALLGVYGGFFGGGVGLIMLPTIVSLFGQDYVRANAVKSGIAFTMNATAFGVFAYSGLIYWAEAVTLASGMLIGSYGGVRIAISQGSAWLRVVLIGVTTTAVAYFLLL